MNRILIILSLLTATLSLCAQTYQEQLKAIHSKIVEERDGKSYYVHSVKRGQTLYMISKSYGVDVNDIIEGNPIVKEGLKADQKLYIPVDVQKKEESSAKPESDIRKPESTTRKPSAENKKPDTSSLITAQGSRLKAHGSSVPCGSDTSAAGKTYNVVLMLPLYLEEVDSMNTETATAEDIDNWNSLKYLPFYEGFLLAVDSLRKQDIHLVLYVYDVGKDSATALQLLKKPELRNADLIIGLLYNRNFQIVAKFAHENKIPLVNPLSERSEIVRDNDMVFKVTPSRDSELDCLAAYMQKSMNRGQVIIIRNGQFRDVDIADRLKKVFLERKLNVTLAEGQDIAIGRLSRSKENVVVAFADNNVYALDLMRRFYELRNDYNISLVGLTAWDQIEGLDRDFLNGLGTHMVSPYFVDYSAANVKPLLRRFQDRFKTDPGQLAFLGFDVGYYFLSALMKYGREFPLCIRDFRLQTSQTSMEFSRAGNNPDNGFENLHWSVFKYEGFKLVRVY